MFKNDIWVEAGVLEIMQVFFVHFEKVGTFSQTLRSMSCPVVWYLLSSVIFKVEPKSLSKILHLVFVFKYHIVVGRESNN